ncbi:MAG: hypothetical protein ACKVVT_01360 [Dehalococcoidia bacterium]
MPTYEQASQFRREFRALNAEERRQFLQAVRALRGDLERHPDRFHPSLRVKRVVAHPGVWEMTWGPDGRATFNYGPEVVAGEPHVVWRRVGTHDIFQAP